MNTIFTTISANVYHFYRFQREEGGSVHAFFNKFFDQSFQEKTFKCALKA